MVLEQYFKQMNLMGKLTNLIRCILFKFRMVGKSNRTLYIIGNGFDIHHGLDTWYSSFGLFLQDKYPLIYENLLKYIGMPDLDAENEQTLYSQEWNEFEKSLANLYYEEIIDEYDEYAANPASDDYHKDLSTIEIYVSEIRDKLTFELFKSFKDFIRQVEYPNLNECKKLNINKKAHFFNFNYTNTLQNYYSIPDSSILYIHKKAETDDVLVLGHGFEPESFTPEEPKMPSGLTEEERQEWIDQQDGMYDVSVEFGKIALLKYFEQSFKDSDSIIEENKWYFTTLGTVERVVIFGHSLSQVDEKYIQKIQSSVSADCMWFVFYRNDSEISGKIDRMVEIGIEKNKIYPFHVNWLSKKCNSVNSPKRK